MAVERQVLEQQLLFSATIEDLQNPNLASIDIENSLNDLAKLTALSPQQAKTILNLGAANIAHWTKVTDPENLLAAFQSPIRVYREYAEQTGQPEIKAEAEQLTSTIVGGVIASDSHAYTKLTPQLKAGVYGDFPTVLSGVVKHLSATLDKEGTIWGDEDDVADFDATNIGIANMIVMIGELQQTGNKPLIEDVKSSLPAKLLCIDQASRMNFSPEMNQLLEEARRGDDPAIKKIVDLYSRSDYGSQDRLKQRVLKGEFGEPVLIVDKIVSTLMAGRDQLDEFQRAEVEEMAYELWLDVLDQDPNNPRLQLITANVIEIAQYWEDDILYTCLESINRLGLANQEELFVTKYGDRILDTLRSSKYIVERDRREQLEQQEHLTKDQQQRIARFLKALGRAEKESGQNLHTELLTGELLGAII